MGVANGKARFMQVRNWLNPAKLCPAFVLCFFFFVRVCVLFHFFLPPTAEQHNYSVK